MVRLVLLILVFLGGADRLAAQEKVDVRGITSVVELEETIFGHLTELNGKYKLRATKVMFAPGGYLGVHHHVGPGIRYVLPVRSHSLKEVRRRSTELATIFSKRGT